MAYYKFHGITPYPCGPRTPWPNRAETAVRLFKRTWSIMAKALADEGYAEKATVRQAVKKVAWARNCQLTVSGYSPLEIATGRRPPDLFDVETSTPEQLSAEPSDEDRTTLDLQRIARGLIKRLDNHLIFGRILPDGSCRRTVHTRREIVRLFGIKMRRRRSLKVYGSVELWCPERVLWFWLRSIALLGNRTHWTKDLGPCFSEAAVTLSLQGRAISLRSRLISRDSRLAPFIPVLRRVYLLSQLVNGMPRTFNLLLNLPGK